MRQPLWIINSALLALFFLCFYIVIILQPKVPQATSLVADQPILNHATNNTPINLKSIYEEDLFKTHITSSDTEVANPVMDIPMPPAYFEFEHDQNNEPVFLEPLPITITGIMTFGSEEQNRALIRDNRNQIEHTYHVGDDLEDAQIIRILSNKVIIIRANSQQETLFLREQDAISDLDKIEPNWNEFIEKVGEQQYSIKTKEFVAQIKNLGKLVDTLNLITAYKNGVSIGVKIGSNSTSPLIERLGLQNGDIIVSINDTNVNSTKGRIAAYNLALEPSTKELYLKITRNGKTVNLQYLLLSKELDKLTNMDNALAVQRHVDHNRSKFENIADKVKDKDRNNIAQFKNKISQSVSR